MKFNEAMEHLQWGHKVSRSSWAGMYLIMNDKQIEAYSPRINHYIYNEEIMLSDGWLVEGMDGERKFYDIIDYIAQGATIRLKGWGEKFVFYDKIEHSLVIHSMELNYYKPDFEDFAAKDWMIIE
jgi:hypothetical protein